MDQETRTFLTKLRDDVIVRLGAVEREATQLRKLFDEESPTRATVKFARDQAGTAFVGVLELRELWRKDQGKRSNVTRLVVGGITAISLITVAVTQFISNINAANTELRAQNIVRRENASCEARIEAHEERLLKRVSDEAVRARDEQIDRIIKGKQ